MVSEPGRMWVRGLMWTHVYGTMRHLFCRGERKVYRLELKSCKEVEWPGKLYSLSKEGSLRKHKQSNKRCLLFFEKPQPFSQSCAGKYFAFI